MIPHSLFADFFPSHFNSFIAFLWIDFVWNALGDILQGVMFDIFHRKERYFILGPFGKTLTA